MSIVKVVKGLKICTNWKSIEDCTECPYLHSPEKCNVKLMEDALALIDELQAKNEKLEKESAQKASDVALKILNEVDDILWKYKRIGMSINVSHIHLDIAELKKKYESEGNK